LKKIFFLFSEKLDSDDIYRVRLGDTAYNIAMAHGMQLDRLRQLNPEKTDFDHIEPGDIFKVA
jgi:LysM domain